MNLTPEFEADIRSRVNPSLVGFRGTASCGFAALLGEIDMLRGAIRQALAENGHLADGDNCTLIVLKRALGIQTCKRCKADMTPGKAIEQTFTGSPDFAGDVRGVTMSPGGAGKLVDCLKCPECGWSVTA